MRVGRQEPDGEGRERHGGDRDDQSAFASVAIADVTEDDAADRAHHEGDREHAEGREQGDQMIGGGKEIAPKGTGEIAVGREVVPFQHIADRAGDKHSRNLHGLAAQRLNSSHENPP